MAIEIEMPALSPTMETGTLAKWLVSVGDRVSRGDPIAEIETDKAAMELEAAEDGRILELMVAEGTADVPVGSVIALLASPAGDVPAAIDMNPAALTPAPSPIDRPSTAAPRAPDKAPPTSMPASAPALLDAGDANATPLARKIAFAQGRPLGGRAGSGPGGRIVKADLVPPSPAITEQSLPARPSRDVAPLPSRAFDSVPHDTVMTSRMRKTIAQRLTLSHQTVPHFHLTVRCRLDALGKQRGELNAGLAARGVRLSLNDMLIKAMALAVEQVPGTNVQFAGDTMIVFKRVDIAMAVAIDGGLVTPVIRDAGSLSLSAIAQQTRRLAERARDGKLTPDEYQGGTVSITNLGMYGVDEIFPVINPPQALILGIGAGAEQPWKVEGGGIGLATICAATAGFDHRAIDGATGARFMAAFRDIVEQPLQILS